MVTGSLTAVEPYWLCVVDDDGEAGSGRRIFGWDETAKETAFERMARIGEGGLSDSVVLGEEIELDRSSDCNSKVVGAVLENTAVSNSNFDGRSRLSVD